MRAVAVRRRVVLAPCACYGNVSRKLLQFVNTTIFYLFIYLFINYCYHFFLTGPIRRWSLSLKNGAFKVDVLWHSGCVCLEFTRCYLVSPKVRELQVPLFHLASNYSIRFCLAWPPGRLTIPFMLTVTSLENNEWRIYYLMKMFETCKASSSFRYSIW